jgi:hypothetical protein
MAVGAIAFVAPISACSEVFPVGVAITRGEALTVLSAAVIAGVALTSPACRRAAGHWRWLV